MEKEHFEILLEKLEDNSRMLAEGLVMTNERLDRMEAKNEERFDRIDQRLDGVDQRFDGMETKFEARFDRLEAAVLDIRSLVGSHETRLCALEAE